MDASFAFTRLSGLCQLCGRWIQAANDLFVDQAVGCDRAVAADGVIALPISDSSTCSFDNRNQCHEVPRIQDRIGHDFSATSSDQIVSMTIAPVVVAFDLARKGLECGTIVMIRHVPVERVEHDRVFKFGSFAHAHRPVVEPGLAAGPNKVVIHDRVVYDADHRPAVCYQSN